MLHYGGPSGFRGAMAGRPRSCGLSVFYSASHIFVAGIALVVFTGNSLVGTICFVVWVYCARQCACDSLRNLFCVCLCDCVGTQVKELKSQVKFQLKKVRADSTEAVCACNRQPRAHARHGRATIPLAAQR